MTYRFNGIIKDFTAVKGTNLVILHYTTHPYEASKKAAHNNMCIIIIQGAIDQVTCLEDCMRIDVSQHVIHSFMITKRIGRSK